MSDVATTTALRSVVSAWRRMPRFGWWARFWTPSSGPAGTVRGPRGGGRPPPACRATAPHVGRVPGRATCLSPFGQPLAQIFGGRLHAVPVGGHDRRVRQASHQSPYAVAAIRERSRGGRGRLRLTPHHGASPSAAQVEGRAADVPGTGGSRRAVVGHAAHRSRRLPVAPCSRAGHPPPSIRGRWSHCAAVPIARGSERVGYGRLLRLTAHGGPALHTTRMAPGPSVQ